MSQDDCRSPVPDRVLDCRGLACPLPVLRARKALAGLAAGKTLLVEATDPMAAIDLPHLARQDGHVLLHQERDGPAERPVLRFLIRRGSGAGPA
ncbi:sulfurtransferase TusA family protein [Prosthecomicrobium pneumaticum]|uniref:tRNA 2-thiouridine synthesizing protein A n=1 Tax=Prosthecomicrobium pneumaticum TaxID=81895 RepID=A0A7W9FK93_9HYPH|nr:sulfurtransferase TusA family protein [Prosthecomicrobium pneumaticum]MBB5752411.1 tRNA 2-thiouridine synthesizing protein A [Prosthecomicrobium pneumaticum]